MRRRDVIDHSNLVVSMAGGGTVPQGGPVDQQVVRSWARSLVTHHLDPSRTARPRILTGGSLRSHQEQIESFLQIARHGIARLHEQVRGAGYVILLTDAQGVTVEFLGNPALDRELREAGLYLGSCWSEAEEGTCGVGTCIVDRRPITIHKAEHFRAPNIRLSCSAAPIFGPEGEFLAVLDASALYSPDAKKSQFLARRFVELTARLIEDANLLHRFSDQWVLKFSRQWEFLEVEAQGILALNDAGRVIAANRAALEALGAPPAGGLLHSEIDRLFDVRFEDLARHGATQGEPRFTLHAPGNGETFFASVRGPRHRVLRAVARSAPQPVAARRTGPLTLAELAGTDPCMIRNVQRSLRLIDRDIPILLRGETGTGKEVFASALHLASSRADKPFVALNCAAIPESLIESELFGYRNGAFTGARTKGMRGKILEASGGTLFLDEIGDMPAHLQTRLLRVLAEKEVVPLGGGTPIRVDLHVICATHRDLGAMVAAGEFREDLYFRLNGVTLTLPPLRERSDQARLIEELLRAEARPEEEGIEMGALAMQVLLAYSWPGNIRQLRNALRYAIAVNDSGVIGLDDLPAEIADTTREAVPAACQATMPDAAGACVALERSERDTLVEALRRHRWVVTAAARELGVCRATVYRKMQRFAIVAPNAQGEFPAEGGRAPEDGGGGTND